MLFTSACIRFFGHTRNIQSFDSRTVDLTTVFDSDKMTIKKILAVWIIFSANIKPWQKTVFGHVCEAQNSVSSWWYGIPKIPVIPVTDVSSMELWNTSVSTNWTLFNICHSRTQSSLVKPNDDGALGTRMNICGFASSSCWVTCGRVRVLIWLGMSSK